MNQSELRNAIHKYGRTLHAMRSEELADNVVAKQKFAKMNNELDNLTDEIAKQNIINQRPPMSWGEKNKNEDEQAEKFKMEYKSAFLKYLRKGIDNDLVELLSKNNDKSNLGLMLKSDAYGYAITADMNEIISNNMFNYSPIRRFAKIINISRENIDMPAYTNEISSCWGDERTVAPETDAFSKKIIQVNDLTAQPKITQRMIEDSEIDHEAWIAELLSDIFSSQEDKAFLHGTGVNQPKGILSYAEGTGNDKIERIAETTSGQVSFEGLLRLQASLDGKYEKGNNTMFLTSKEVLAQIRSLKDQSGQYIWTSGILVGGNDNIFGTPIFASSEMDTTNGDAVIYGNLRKGYQIVDRADIKIQRDPYSSKPFVIYFATKRVGGDVVDTNAIKVLKF